MNGNKDKDKDLESNREEAESNKVSSGRRKFAKAGLITPVLMSFSSHPALAACSQSGIQSGNLSGPGEEICVPALSAAYWDANRDQWEDLAGEPVNESFGLNGYFQEGTTFRDIYDGLAGRSNGIAMRNRAAGATDCSGSSAFEGALMELLYQAIAAAINVITFGENNSTVPLDSIRNRVSTAFESDRKFEKDRGKRIGNPQCESFPKMSGLIRSFESKNNGNAYP